MGSMRNAVNAACGVLVALALGGCSGILAVDPTPSPTPSATPSPSYSVPAEARAHTPEGAAAFARFYYQQLNRSYTQPAAHLLPPLGASTCEACASYNEFTKGLVDRGERVDPAPVEMVKVIVKKGSTSDRAIVEVQMRQVAAKVLDAKNAVVTTQEPKEYSVVLEILWEGDRWVLGSVN